MIVLLNGPLGIGKSTLAEAMVERMDRGVMLDGDALLAVNPEPANPQAELHDVIALLVAHHRERGYVHFVINHIWRSPAELADLRGRLADGTESHAFLLSLPASENLRRITRRASTRALDELEYELRTVAEERECLAASPVGVLGTPFAVDAAPEVLAERLLRQLGLALAGPSRPDASVRARRAAADAGAERYTRPLSMPCQYSCGSRSFLSSHME